MSIGLHDEAPVASAAGPELARVLLVSGLDHWADRIESDLTAEGFLVLRDPTGEWVFDEERIRQVHVVVVDLRLRAQSGLAVCGAVRARSLLPILALGDQDDEAPVLAAYSAGADQYVTIDTSSRLVTARLRASAPPGSAPDRSAGRDQPRSLRHHRRGHRLGAGRRRGREPLEA